MTDEFNLIMHMDDARETFDSEWYTWEPAIIDYACAIQRKPDALQHAICDKDGDGGTYTTLHLYHTSLSCIHFSLQKQKPSLLCGV